MIYIKSVSNIVIKINKTNIFVFAIDVSAIQHPMTFSKVSPAAA